MKRDGFMLKPLKSLQNEAKLMHGINYKKSCNKITLIVSVSHLNLNWSAFEGFFDSFSTGTFAGLDTDDFFTDSVSDEGWIFSDTIFESLIGLFFFLSCAKFDRLIFFSGTVTSRAFFVSCNVIGRLVCVSCSAIVWLLFVTGTVIGLQFFLSSLTISSSLKLSASSYSFWSFSAQLLCSSFSFCSIFRYWYTIFRFLLSAKPWPIRTRTKTKIQ